MGLSNYLPSSRLIQPGVIANSGERPASPYEGQAIYQRDTDQVLYWNGSAWYPAWNMPWGVVTRKTSTSNSAVISSEAVTLTSDSFTAVANRLYRISYHEPTVQQFGATLTYARSRFRLTGLTGTVLDVADTLTNTFRNTINVFTVVTLSAGSTVVVSTLQADSGSLICSGGTDTIRQIIVEDIGPA